MSELTSVEELSTEKYYKAVVRIISHSPIFDWKYPFRIEGMSTSSGTGFFIDNKGHILTCSHVVESAKNVYIEIPSEGKKEYSATVLGICPYFDLALIRIENYQNNDFLELEKDDSHVIPGNITFAIGFPLGQDNLKLTKGIISGQQYNYFQIDTPINPGNSGGPLIKNNKVIGVNGAGIMLANNIGYAVPISRYWLIEDLMFEKENNLIIYPEVLGIDFQKTSPEMKTFLNSGCNGGGVLIKKIFKDSPISTSKLKVGDILCSINDISIDFYGELDKRWMGQRMNFPNFLATLKLNELVKITYWNGTTMKNDHFSFKEYKLPIRKMYPIQEKIDYDVLAGMVFMPLTMNLIEQSYMFGGSNLSDYAHIKNRYAPKVAITTVFKGSYLSSLRIINGIEVIDKVNGYKVETLDELREAILQTVTDLKKVTRKKFIIITTKQKNIIVIPVDKIIEEEKNLSEVYHYQVSPLFTKLSQAGRRHKVSSRALSELRKKTLKKIECKCKSKKKTESSLLMKLYV